MIGREELGLGSRQSLRRMLASARTGFIRELARTRFDSSEYWERRYATGGNSGPGSHGRLAEFKAAVVNDFILTHRVKSMVEFGCGDGHQVSLGRYPTYVGLDVSRTAVELCQTRFAADPTKRFDIYRPGVSVPAELALSMDVIFHLVEKHVFEQYMNDLFQSASRYVGIYSWDFSGRWSAKPVHVRDRQFSAWIAAAAPDWRLVQKVANPFYGLGRDKTLSEFFFYAQDG
jgi:hypothetical protein